MAIENATVCDDCQKRLEEGNEVYCYDCYTALEDRITELEKEIGNLEARIAEQGEA